MSKFKFTTEFEFRASSKILYQYISQPSGLQQWFAEKVKVLGENRMDFVWDGDSHAARLSLQRLNKLTRFDFDNGNYVEFKLETSELTGSSFLKITDYSDNSDEEDLKYLWEDMVDRLRDIVGS